LIHFIAHITSQIAPSTCHQCNLRLLDGTDHMARFQLQAKAASADEGAKEGSSNQIFLPFVNRKGKTGGSHIA